MTVPLPAARRWSLTILVMGVAAASGPLPGLRPSPAPPVTTQPVRSAATEAAIATLKQQGTYASLQAAFEQARYGVHPAENLPDVSSTYVAHNPAQRYQATFTPAGLELAGRDAARPWRVGVTLSTIGRAGVDASVLWLLFHPAGSAGRSRSDRGETDGARNHRLELAIRCAN
jgi:hypothetical protein